MRPLRVVLLCMFVVLLCGACSLKVGGQPAARKYYVLDDKQRTASRSFVPRPLNLMIRDTTASPIIDSRKIIFSDNPSTRGFYRFAFWVEPPPKRFAFLLAHRIEETRLFASVLRRPRAVTPDLILYSQVTDFYHDTSSKPGTVKISVTVTLIDSRKQALVASKRFSLSGEVDNFDAAGAVRGFDRTASKILDQVVIWLDEATGSWATAITHGEQNVR